MTGTDEFDDPDAAQEAQPHPAAEVEGTAHARASDATDAKGAPDADAAAVAGRPAPSSHQSLSRDRIVQAAIAFIDEHGLAGLSMRRLGAILGVEAMSLYRYVSGREQLLDAIVEGIVDQMADDPDVIDHPQFGWQDYLQRLAHGIRRVALAHPKAFPLVASRPAEAPWLRPPLRSLRWVEAFLEGLRHEGFGDTAIVESYRAFTSFLLGHLLLEVAALGADLGPLDVLEDDNDTTLAPYANVRRLATQLREDHSAVEFEDSLENLLSRLALIHAENSAS